MKHSHDFRNSMAQQDINPTMTAIEEHAEKARVAGIRFKQQILQTAGGAMLFALVAMVTTHLLSLGGGLLMPALGIGTVAALGLGAVFLAARYLTDAISLDQDSQAKKIHEAAKGKEVDIPAIAPSINKPIGLPSALSAQDAVPQPVSNLDTPSTSIAGGSAQWMDKMIPANDRSAAKPQAPDSWIARQEAASALPQTVAAGR